MSGIFPTDRDYDDLGGAYQSRNNLEGFAASAILVHATAFIRTQ